MSVLQLLAGPAAYRRVQQGGLSAADIDAVMGASGAAKWLTIYGLDKAIFSEWLSTQKPEKPINLFGTSVGAFKLAAAAQQDSAAALGRLAQAYIAQRYDDDLSPEAVVRETSKIIDAVLTPKAVGEILQNPRFNFFCGAVWSHGLLGQKNHTAQKIAMIKAFVLSLAGRRFHQRMLARTVFGPADCLEQIGATDGFETEKIAFSADNLKQCVLASGSIPVVMNGVDTIGKDQPDRIYRDGGLLDYHPVAANLLAPGSGLILYPHFYPYLIEGWFDKFFPWRKVSGARLDNVLLIAPSQSFVDSLPNKRIPDRQDFYRYQGNDQLRQQQWREVADRSLELGEEWLRLVQTGSIAEHVRPI